MKNFLETVKVAVLPENEKGQLKQNVRNDFRSDLLDALQNTLSDLGVDVVRSEEGIGMNLPNETLGSIPVVIGVTIKDIGFDIFESGEAYELKLAEKVEKAKVAEALKQQKIAEKEALKVAKAKKTNAKK